MSLTCDTCGGRLKIKVNGGEFLLTDGSSLQNVNFNSVEDVIQKALGTTSKVPDDEKEDLMTVEVFCILDPDHLVFETSISRIKFEVFERIHQASMRLMQKYYTEVDTD